MAHAHTRLLLRLLGASALASIPVAASAANTAGNTAKSTDVSEVIVTAQKRTQTEFKVPLSVTAIGAKELQSRGANAIEDLASSVPGLTITEYAPGNQRVALRGISVYSGLPTTGVYLDEIPLNVDEAQSGQDVRLININRIEVLRGPQGTLYGQGAMGGTIRYITNDPDPTKFSGSLSGEGAGVDHGGVDWDTNAVLNIPIVTDKVALRLDGGYQNFGGWIDNTITGAHDENSGHTSVFRAKLLVDVTSALKVTGFFDHQDLSLGAINASDANLQVAQHVPSTNGQTVNIGNLTATYDFGGVTLLSSASYIDRSDYQNSDISPLYVPVLQAVFALPAGTLQSVSLGAATHNKVFNEETRLSSNGDGALNWTVGGAYRDATLDTISTSAISPNILPITLLAGGSTATSKSWAVFGEGSYRLLPDVTATIGGRYFQDQRGFNSNSIALGTAAHDVGNQTFDAFSPHFNLAWTPTDQLDLYLNAAKGFRSGGFNDTSSGLGVVTVPPSYGPDVLWSYEVGAKFRSSDRKIEAEVAVYHNDWTNVQTLAFAPGSLLTYTTNGGRLEGWGVDSQLTLHPVTGLTLSASASWNNMAYQTKTADHLRGDPADYVPAFTGAASAEYRFHWTDALGGVVRIDYQHSDPFQVFVRDAMAAPAVTDPTELLNARLGVLKVRWDVSLFAHNILGRSSIVSPAFGALLYPIRLEPRTIGAAATVNF